MQGICHDKLPGMFRVPYAIQAPRIKPTQMVVLYMAVIRAL
jgi:hypothetical protein